MSSCDAVKCARTAANEESPLLGGLRQDPPITREENVVPLIEEVPFSKVMLIMSSIWIGVFLAAMDGTIISTLLAPISSEFESFASLSWITTSYLISQTALQPLFGKLTDIYGRRQGLIVSNCLFGLGTAMCGFAKNEYVLIAGRVIAGAGGGVLASLSSIVASDLVPLRQRGLIQGVGGVVWGIGAALGGFYGGVINDSIGWRWAFLSQVPLIALAAVCAMIFVNIPVKKTEVARHKRIDYLGALNIVTFLVLFLLVLNTGGVILPWTHPLIMACLPLSFVFLGAFILTEKKFAKEPILPLEIMKDRTVAAACMASSFCVMTFYCTYFFLPLYFMLQGSSTRMAGLRLIPQSIGVSIGSLGAGAIMSLTGRYYLLGICAMFILNLGTGVFCTFGIQTAQWPQLICLLLLGAGFSSTMSIGLIALIAGVDHPQQAIATSAVYLFRSTGATIGAAVGSAVFQATLRKGLTRRLGDGGTADEIIETILKNFEEVFKVDPQYRDLVVDSYMEALRSVFCTAFVMGAIGMLCIAMVREHKLYKTLDRR